MIIIDNYSVKLWAYIIKTKDQVLDYFQKFHVVVERGTWWSIKAVRSDNEGKYKVPFEEYHRNYKIKHESTVLKTS